MDQSELEFLKDKHLGDLKNDPRVLQFLGDIQEQLSQYKIDQILSEKAKSNFNNPNFQALIKIANKIIKANKSKKKICNSETNLQTITKVFEEEYEKFNEQIHIYKERIQQLENTNKELDQFAYVVAHDLKAPLRGISNLVEWIEEDLQSNATNEIDNHLKMLRARAARLENIIHGILSYAKAEKKEKRIETINTRKNIDDIIELLQPPKHIIINLEGEWPIIETDPTRFHQVFINLISNAIKYNDKQAGKITIGSTIQDNKCQFYIEDNGEGIEEEYHQKIFHLFQTLSVKDEKESTGIGLSIVKNIIDEMGGKIWIESKLHIGTKFIIEWPLNQINTTDKKYA